ncbi:MAG: DUF1273 domain-containing protein [Oscillospiraceae bacterium]|jgi:uncharacterized phage-like protein YoqJ|nr:DUF1273 domain-containing protein [Oscillospiraceae bacterium]
MEINIAERPVTCCFSGYRPEKLPWTFDEDDPRCEELKRKIADVIESLYDSGVRKFVCGMARGADMYFAEAVIALRETRAGVTLEAAIPCEEQAARWSERERARYFRLLSQCDTETFVSRRYTDDCMRRRNRYMADKSSVIITVFDGKVGGTMYTRAYAARRGLEVIDLKP